MVLEQEDKEKMSIEQKICKILPKLYEAEKYVLCTKCVCVCV